MKRSIYLFFAVVICGTVSAQSIPDSPQTALDFLTIPIDSRAAALGDAGIATSPDAYSHQYNPAKYVFGRQKAGVSLSYLPWLRNLVKDMSITNIQGYFVMDSLQSISGSLRYFALGEIKLYDANAASLGSKSPTQLALDLAYGRKLSQNFSASVGFRYVMSDIYSGVQAHKKGHGLGVDLSSYFQTHTVFYGLPTTIGAGAGLYNLGTKISYTDNKSYFMPMQFKLGGSFSLQLDQVNSLMLSTDIARSLVPTSSENFTDSPLTGMINSFDKGGFNSLLWGIGVEYGYNKMLFGRMGYFTESSERGGRKNLSFGAGIVYNIIHFDCAYLVPTFRNNPMSNTLRFSISVDIAK